MNAGAAVGAATDSTRPRGHRGMETNAVILMISSLITGALGIGYWIIAEHLYPTEQVGRAAALISTATMLSSLACLSLGGSYQRFLPLAGQRTRRLILAGLGLTGAVALLLGGVFALAGPGRDRLFDGPVERWLFPALVVVFTGYALLDPILVGLRRAGLVGVKNVSLSVLKIVPLPLLAFTATGSALIASWVLLALLVTAVMTAMVLRTAVSGLQGVPSQLPPTRQLWAFQGATFTLMLVQTVTPLCLPLIVLSLLGPEHSAYYNLVASLGVAVSLLRAGVLSSYVVEASVPGADRRALSTRMLRLLTLVSLVCAGGLALGGPLLLRLVSDDYATAATPLVLVMAAETVVGGLVAGYAGVAQVTRRLRLLVAVQAVVVVVTVGGALVLVPRLGLVGVGVAGAAAQLVALAAVALPLGRMVRAMSSGQGAG